MASPPSQYGAISIHVSVRRRTMQIMQDAEHFVISNHVSLRKRTDSYYLEYCAREFQLASPQGDEPYLHLLPQRQLKFQLTSPQGDEHKSLYTWIRGIYISTHVSARRRTWQSKLCYFSLRISTHVSARRRTSMCTFLLILLLFQFTSP